MAKISVSAASTHDGWALELEQEIRREARKSFKQAGNVVAKRAKALVPAPGYPGDKPEFVPLRDTIGTEVKEGREVFAVVGPKRPAGDKRRAGAHGHLVETSHRHFSHKVETGTLTEATPFLGPASTETLPDQIQIIDAAMIAAGKKRNGVA